MIAGAQIGPKTPKRENCPVYNVLRIYISRSAQRKAGVPTQKASEFRHMKRENDGKKEVFIKKQAGIVFRPEDVNQVGSFNS